MPDHCQSRQIRAAGGTALVRLLDDALGHLRWAGSAPPRTAPPIPV